MTSVGLQQLARSISLLNISGKILTGMGVAKGGAEGAKAPPWILKFLVKKGNFLNFWLKKQNSLLLASPGKILEKSLSAPPWEHLSDAHAHRSSVRDCRLSQTRSFLKSVWVPPLVALKSTLRFH